MDTHWLGGQIRVVPGPNDGDPGEVQDNTEQ